MLPFGGAVRVSDPDPAHGGCGDGPHNPIIRCSMSNACVVDPGRIRTADAIGDALV